VPFGIRIEGDKRSLRANRRDVAWFEIAIIDKNGIIVPDADNMIELKVTGPARLLGLDNGDVADLTKVQSLQRKVFKGKCAGMIQSLDQRGSVRIDVMSKGLKHGEYFLQVH
jgi:beta-galactosidase